MEEGGAATTRATIRIQGLIREEEPKVLMEEEQTPKEAARTLGIMGGGEEGAATVTVTTKTEAGIRRGVEVEVEQVGGAEAGEAEEEAGEEEGDRR